jgi:class 3 adenylate cyclase
LGGSSDPGHATASATARRPRGRENTCRIRGFRSELIDPTIATHHGRVVKRTDDGILIEFRYAVDAVR